MTELFFFLGVCVEADHVRPTCGRIGTLEIMLDGIGENICFALSVLSGVLLRTKHYSLASLHPVNPIYYFIKPLHLLKLFSVDVE